MAKVTRKRENKGKPQTMEAATRHALGSSAGALKRDAPGSGVDGIDMQAHWANVSRIKAAEARIKEAKARAADLAEMERAGALIRAELVGSWAKRLLMQFRTDLDAADSLVDLQGHTPEVADAIRSVVSEVLGRLRHRLASAPQLGTPPPTIDKESA